MAEAKKNIIDWLFSTENEPTQTRDIKMTRLSESYGGDGVFRVKGLSFTEMCHYRAMQDDAARQMGILLAGVVYPDLKDKDAYRVAGFKSAEEAVKKKLLPGEISVLANEIAKLSGYGVSVGEELNVAEEIEKN